MYQNTDKYGRRFDLQTRSMVWNKGRIVVNYNPHQVREDACGKKIRWAAYGDTSDPMGWEIDHIVPKSKGGGDEIFNLQPLHWLNNRMKGDDFPHWNCAA